MKKYFILILICNSLMAENYLSLTGVMEPGRHPNELMPAIADFRRLNDFKGRKAIWFPSKFFGVLSQKCLELAEQENLLADITDGLQIFSKLKSLDKNQDSKLTSEELGLWQIWNDINGDASCRSSEISNSNLPEIDFSKIQTFTNSFLDIHFNYIQLPDQRLLVEVIVPLTPSPLLWNRRLRELRAERLNIWQFEEVPRVRSNLNSIDGYLTFDENRGTCKGSITRILKLDDPQQGLRYRITVFDFTGHKVENNLNFTSECSACTSKKFKSVGSLLFSTSEKYGSGRILTEVFEQDGTKVETLDRSLDLRPEANIPDLYYLE